MVHITGYIGGSVLSRLLAHPDANTFNIVALTRSEEKSQKLKALGVNTAIGSHTDSALIESLAADSDVVVATVRPPVFE